MTWSKTAITIAGMADGTEGNGQNQLSHPYTLAIGQNHEIYIADSHNNRIQKWTMNSGTGTTVAGNADGSSGAQVNVQNCYGVSSLLLSTKSSNREFVQVLTEVTANVNIA
ncbi:unnamed protein product [Rotaria sordida]|uniref:NHL repeat containing protein n=1 Tax=Rotaria sordida TaxID=392033 RepID=A0A814L563_9BILA|nr:unnamed protein product [Rotaria sordida]CAF3950298.1 unnamed protein product [Rotaria sordida]CAF4081214.1 unnamed protein product [Rotaria sordida]